MDPLVAKFYNDEDSYWQDIVGDGRQFGGALPALFEGTPQESPSKNGLPRNHAHSCRG